MQVKSTVKYVRISAKKARPLAKVLRGKVSTSVLQQLRFDTSKTGRIMYKLIASAVANAKNNYNIKEDNLKIKSLTIDVGPSFKRYWFRSHGSADRLLKRTSHFAVVLEEINPTLVKKTVTTKVKKEAPVKAEEVKTEAKAEATPKKTATPKAKTPEVKE